MEQRPIKFRVYGENPDNDFKVEMFTIDSYYFEEWGTWDNDFSNAMPNNGVLMQFTGLLDRHGKEIYEGDIVEIDYSHGLWEDTSKLEIVWVKEYAGLVVKDKIGCVGTALILCDAEKVRIIGNIYENPDLLPTS